MKSMIALSLLALMALPSCKKMALRHTCTCELSRSIDGYEEALGSTSHEQIGSYSRAVDSCSALQDAYTYTTSKDGRTEIHTANCEVQ